MIYSFEFAILLALVSINIIDIVMRAKLFLSKLKIHFF